MRLPIRRIGNSQGLILLMSLSSHKRSHAWKYRYPGEPEEPTRDEADGALALAREVYEAILACLPEEVQP